MANDLTADPLVLDTAHATNVVVQGGRFLYAIHYVGATTAGHQALLTTEADARPFFRATATGNGADVFTLLRIVTPDNLVLPTMSSGTLYIYLGPER